MQICVNCGNKDVEKTAENEYYCSKCDQTFTIEKGKRTRAKPTNRIAQIEEEQKKQGEKIDKVIETLKPKPPNEEGGLDWPK